MREISHTTTSLLAFASSTIHSIPSSINQCNPVFHTVRRHWLEVTEVSRDLVCWRVSREGELEDQPEDKDVMEVWRQVVT